ncbi:hypothetical protein [Sphaerisporangium siamense]|uniref:Uncharacterized protein n=1 Tax=Sphaerisporangium siamense TaxID=795645 RepID=A0A7W7G904_9ACTN|nr:hypothetical protein [Sphaerisporangium siamense]MBB4700074.1 hypothetical protein [Sphaerisporangium siamense]
MSLNPYPADQNEILRDLQRQINALAAEVKRVTGVPVTKASAPFLVPSASAPAAPSSGAYLYVSGGEVYVRSTSRHYSTLPPEVPQAAEVAPAANITSGNAPSSYSQSWAQQIYDGLVSSKNTINATLVALKNADLMLG